MWKFVAFFAFFIAMQFRLVFGVADPNCSVAQAPSWIKSIPFEAVAIQGEDDDENVRFLLLDVQVDLDAGTKYTQLAKALLTASAVQQNSLIELEFDPEYESIILHKLCIYRDQECIDKIASSQQEVIQPERDIDDYQYNGRKVWMILLDDVQKGDIVEYSFSRIGSNPALKGIYNEEFYLQTYYPLKHGSYRIVGSQTRSLHFKGQGTDLKPVHSLLPDGRQEWSWEVFEVEPYQLDSSSPSWYLGAPVLQVSEFANWSDLAIWGSDAFALPNTYSTEIQQLIDQWKEQYATDEERIMQALRFVQKEVRYLGIEMGSSTHQPEDPNLVLQRRYGDCKDKTLLLKTFLALMGIDAQAVLVSSSLRDRLSEWHPAISLFDHVILQVSHNGRLHWVDPTLSHQECPLLTQTSCGHYGKGLVLASHSTDLVDMPVSVSSKILVKTNMEIGAPGESCLIEKKITYLGGDAERVRGVYRQYGYKEIERYYDDYFGETYGAVEKSAPLEVQDDEIKNAFSFKVSYVLQELWKEDQENQQYYFTLFPKHIFESLDFNINPSRQTPLALDHPVHISEHMTIIDRKGDWVETDLQKKFVSNDIAFQYEKKAEGNMLKLRYELKTKQDHVPVERIGEHRKLLQAIEEYLFVTIRVSQTDAESIAGLFENDNYHLLGPLSICYAWIIYLFVRKKKTKGCNKGGHS